MPPVLPVLPPVVVPVVPPPDDAACTVTAAEPLPEPPAPLQVRVKVLLALSELSACWPLVAREPAQPPEAVHEVASCELQLSVVEPPAVIVAGLALMLTTGAGVALPEPLSPLPVPAERR